MTTKKPATRRPTASRPTKRVTVLDKYSGALKLFANYGFAGLAFGYLLTVTIPEAQKAHNAALEKISEDNREDRKSAFDHGEKAVERIASSIDGLRGTFSTVQGTTQANQRELIVTQQRTNELLEQHVSGDSPAASPASTIPLPEWVPVKPKAKKGGL